MKRGAFILLVLFLMPFISAINSTNYDIDKYVVSQGGGNSSSTNYKVDLNLGEIAGDISSASYQLFLGFWHGVTNICGDGSCDAGEDCTSCVADCPCGSGYTCTAGTCVVTVAGAAAPSGGAAVAGAGRPSLDFDITPWLYEKTMIAGRTDTGELTITNNEKRVLIFNLQVEVLGEIVILDETSVNISAGESKIIGFTINAPEETGIYTGKVVVSSGSIKKNMLFSLNVRTEKSLFDIILTIPKAMKTIIFGREESISVQIDLLQMGIKEQMDVTLYYLIKDFDGNSYFKESETIAVHNEKSFNKEFYIQELPPNDYVIGAELIYLDGVAVASSQFSIQEEVKATKENMIVVVSAVLFLVVLAAAWFAIKRYKRKRMHLIKSKK